MANKSLFTSKPGKAARPTDTVNNAGGIAYAFTPEHGLAQLATTGCLSNTYYTNAKDQLASVIELANKCSPEYIAKCAVYARQRGFMKDMPALLCAVLAGKATHGAAGDEARKYLALAFPKVIDNDKMLRNFVQILRSNAVGRKSMGTFVKRLVRQWVDSRLDTQLFRSSVGESPSLKDIIKLSHVKPGESTQRQATFKYLLDQPEEAKADAETKKKGLFYKAADLPDLIKHYEAFKANTNSTSTPEIPDVPFQMLTQLPLTTGQWTAIALKGNWHFVRMNLNTFARHGVLKDKEVVRQLATKLRDEAVIKKARVFPYQLLTAYQATEHSADVPMELKLALQDALEIATTNTPSLGEDVWIFPDVSGSMGSPVTGDRGSASTYTKCVDVAALFAACVLRTTPGAQVIPVDTQLHTKLKLNPRDTVLTNAQKLAGCGGGGTALSLALEHILSSKAKAQTIVFFSDNESWADRGSYFSSAAAPMETLFRKIQVKNPKCKLVCIDLQPNSTTQAKNASDILNVGGFNDNVWTVLDAFVNNKSDNAWVDEINKITLVEENPQA